MKGVFTAAALAAALSCGACSEPPSLTSPSSARPGSLLESANAGAGWHAASVPFKGNLQGSQTFTPPSQVNGSATGTATHLGLFTVQFPHTVDFVTRTGRGTFTFTAANGDTLTADFTGQAQQGAIVAIEEHATITGGTGRFEGASGTFIVRRTFNPANGTTEGSFGGTISALGAAH
jgi:hypothetical protein